jgi:hypothetical protein
MTVSAFVPKFEYPEKTTPEDTQPSGPELFLTSRWYLSRPGILVRQLKVHYRDHNSSSPVLA